MAVILAYTPPALGHLLPFCALLLELSARGHSIHVRTLSSGVDLCRAMGFAATGVDSRIEELPAEERAEDSVLQTAGNTVRALTARAELEVDDLRCAVADVEPDFLIIDANCWGAISLAECQPRPWLVLSPFVPYLRSPGSAPFGAGATPMPGLAGRIRDLGVGAVTRLVFDRPFRTGMASVRTGLHLPPVASADALLRRAPAVLVTTSKPFEYVHTDWGPTVELIGPIDVEPPLGGAELLDGIEEPIVLVTTSSVAQQDWDLVEAAIDALSDDPVHIVATCPSAADADVLARPGVTVSRFIPHSAVLDRAVCVITHGGMGITQKALARGVPVCVVPFGRDQFEVARRVEVARCGTRLPARELTVERLRAAVLEAMTRTRGVQAVAEGFRAAGGAQRGADVVESELAARDTRV